MSLKAAREKAAEGRALVEAGVDPIAEWNKADAEEVPTFGKTADDFLAAHEGGWRNDKHKAQWAMTLTTLLRAYPQASRSTRSTRKPCFRFSSPCGRERRKPPRAFAGASSTILDAAKARGFIGATKSIRRARGAIWTSSCRSAAS